MRFWVTLLVLLMIQSSSASGELIFHHSPSHHEAALHETIMSLAGTGAHHFTEEVKLTQEHQSLTLKVGTTLNGEHPFLSFVWHEGKATVGQSWRLDGHDHFHLVRGWGGECDHWAKVHEHYLMHHIPTITIPITEGYTPSPLNPPSGGGGNGPVPPQSVPEPSTLLLVSTALAMGVLWALLRKFFPRCAPVRCDI